MILSIFLTILLLGILLVCVGFWFQKPYVTVTGFVFLFLLGINLVTGVEYQSGNTITESGGTTTVTYDYTTYTNRTIGIFFSIIFALAFITTLLEYNIRRNP